jgi:glyoxalase family protein
MRVLPHAIFLEERDDLEITAIPTTEDWSAGDYVGLAGLHHVTAITGTASENVAFYTRALGMRLVKRTVNQDDVAAYHLFYADAAGRAGTDVTFFDWPHAGADRRGAGTVGAIALRVEGRALGGWVERLERLGIPHEGLVERDGRRVLAFTDAEGQRLELVADEGAALPAGTPWEGGGVAAADGVRGLHGATLTVARMAPTEWALTEVMGFRRRDVEEKPPPGVAQVGVFETGPGGPGAEVRVHVPVNDLPGQPGRGGVHHVAFRTASVERQDAWRRRIESAGLGVTPLIDRFYFSSIYFREPGGVLFEIATDGPGFATDEPLEHLGEGLALPPFLEPRRAEIEAGLRPIDPLPGRYS